MSHWPEHCELQTSTWSCYYKDEIRIRETSLSSCRFSLSFPAGQVGIHKISRPNSIHTYREWIQDGSGRAEPRHIAEGVREAAKVRRGEVRTSEYCLAM